MMNGMNGSGYGFPKPEVTNLAEALNCYGCGMEQVQALLRLAADEAQSFTENDGLKSDADRSRMFDLWMLLEATRAREETLDALFHAAESFMLTHGYQPRSQRPDTTAWDAAVAAYRRANESVDAVASAEPGNDTAIDALTDHQTAALDDLLDHRAPTHAALLEKLMIIDTNGYHNQTLAWDSIANDVRVLGGGIED